MDQIIQFLGDLFTKVEFWSVSTLGVGLSSIFSMIWVRRSNLSLVASNVLQKGLKEEIASIHLTDSQLQTSVLSLAQENKELKEQVALLNQNIYILAQAANIGLENKESITRNYLSINNILPEVKVIEVIKDVAIKSITASAEEIKSQSTLNELLKKI